MNFAAAEENSQISKKKMNKRKGRGGAENTSSSSHSYIYMNLILKCRVSLINRLPVGPVDQQ